MAWCESLRDPVFHVLRFDCRLKRMKQKVDDSTFGLASFLVLADLQLISTHSSLCSFIVDLVLQTSAREDILQCPKVKQCRVYRQQRDFKEVAQFKGE